MRDDLVVWGVVSAVGVAWGAFEMWTRGWRSGWTEACEAWEQREEVERAERERRMGGVGSGGGSRRVVVWAVVVPAVAGAAEAAALDDDSGAYVEGKRAKADVEVSAQQRAELERWWATKEGRDEQA